MHFDFGAKQYFYGYIYGYIGPDEVSRIIYFKPWCQAFSQELKNNTKLEAVYSN